MTVGLWPGLPAQRPSPLTSCRPTTKAREEWVMAQAVGQLGGAVGVGSLSWYASGPRLRPLQLSVLCPSSQHHSSTLVLGVLRAPRAPSLSPALPLFLPDPIPRGRRAVSGTSQESEGRWCQWRSHHFSPRVFKFCPVQSRCMGRRGESAGSLGSNFVVSGLCFITYVVSSSVQQANTSQIS